MAVPAVLVVSITFDPPTFDILGPIQETTIAKLNDQLPLLCTNSCHGRRKPEGFTRRTGPSSSWHMELRGMIAEIPSKMALMVAIFDALEEEGGWGFHDGHALTTEFEEAHKFFFMRKSR